MTTTAVHPPPPALHERLFGATVAALELHAVYLGRELGLYARLDELGSATPPALAAAAAIDVRYAREWLEQQAVAGMLEVVADDPDPGARAFALPAAHRGTLVDADDPEHVAPFAHMLVGIGAAMPLVAEAYRTGDGVPYSAYGSAFRDGQGCINRPAFSSALPGPWLEAMPDVRRRLEHGERLRVADLGCGQGWSAVALADRFPRLRVDGLDADAASIADARRLAEERGLDGRVRFLQRDAADVGRDGPYDVVLLLEALHDLARPVATLRAVRRALRSGGTVLVADERVGDAFAAPGDAVERMMYGWSVTHCLPTQMVERPSAATGTVLRVRAVEQMAQEAGFASVAVLPVDDPVLRLYRLEVAA